MFLNLAFYLSCRLVDRFGVDVLLLDAIARMSGGLVNVAIIFTSHYYLFLAEAAVFGTCMGRCPRLPSLTKA